MFDVQMQRPEEFIIALREFHESQEPHRGELANAMADAIVSKRVDLAAVRQALLDSGDQELLDTLSRFVDLIEPYIEEGGVEE